MQAQTVANLHEVPPDEISHVINVCRERIARRDLIGLKLGYGFVSPAYRNGEWVLDIRIESLRDAEIREVVLHWSCSPRVRAYVLLDIISPHHRALRVEHIRQNRFGIHEDIEWRDITVQIFIGSRPLRT